MRDVRYASPVVRNLVVTLVLLLLLAAMTGLASLYVERNAGGRTETVLSPRPLGPLVVAMPTDWRSLPLASDGLLGHTFVDGDRVVRIVWISPRIYDQEVPLTWLLEDVVVGLIGADVLVWDGGAREFAAEYPAVWAVGQSMDGRLRRSHVAAVLRGPDAGHLLVLLSREVTNATGQQLESDIELVHAILRSVRMARNAGRSASEALSIGAVPSVKMEAHRLLRHGGEASLKRTKGML